MRCFYTTLPPSIPPEQLASGSRRVSRQSSSQWIPPSTRQVSRQSCSPVDPAQYTARAARPRQSGSPARQSIPLSIPQWIPPSILPASGSRRVTHHQSSPPVDPAKYPAEYPRVARQWIPPSIPLSTPCRRILPIIRPVSSRSGSPAFASGSRQYPARVLLNVQKGRWEFGVEVSRMRRNLL